MAAVHDPDQPLTSMEFEAGSGDYGEDLSRLLPAGGRRAQGPPVRGAGQPAAQPVPVHRRAQPAAGDAGRRRQRPHRVHRASGTASPRRSTRRARQNPTLRRRAARAFAAVRGGRRPAGRLRRGARRPRARLRARPLPDRVPPPGVGGRAPRRWPTWNGSAAWARATCSPGRCCSPASRSRRSTSVRRRRRCRRLVALGQPGDARPRRAGAAGRARARRRPAAAARPRARPRPRRRAVHGARRRARRPAGGAGRRRRRTTSRPWPAHGWAAKTAEVRVGYAPAAASRPTASRCSPRSAPAGRWRRRSTSARGGRVVLACDYPCHLPFWRTALESLGVRPRLRHDAGDPASS